MAVFDISNLARQEVLEVAKPALEMEAKEEGLTDTGLRVLAFNNTIRKVAEGVVDEIVAQWEDYAEDLGSEVGSEEALEYLSTEWSPTTIADYVLGVIDYEAFRDTAVDTVVLTWENLPMTSDIDSSVLTQVAQNAPLRTLFKAMDYDNATAAAEQLIPEEYFV